MQDDAVAVEIATQSTGSAAASAAASGSPLAEIARSLALSAEVWSVIKSFGACACCAARFAGCDIVKAYDCHEPDLRAQLDARFQTQNIVSPLQLPAATEAGTRDTGREMDTKPCTLCLGLLQPEVPLVLMPPARPSGESRGPDDRACLRVLSSTVQDDEATNAPLGVVAPANSNDEHVTVEVARTGAGCVPENGLLCPEEGKDDNATTGEVQSATATTGSRDAVMAVDGAAEIPPLAGIIGQQRRRARLADSVVEYAASRGYTVSSFATNAAVPACLAVRDAAFLVVLCDLLQRTTSTDAIAMTTPLGKIAQQTAFPATAAMVAPAVVSVKDALKFALASALEAQFGVPHDNNSDFVVEVTAKAAEADAHAMKLLGGPALAQSATGKNPGWPGIGRWAKKRQRREEHRFPGLTIGAVKKGLANLTEEGRERMRRWVEGLTAGGDGGGSGGECGVGGDAEEVDTGGVVGRGVVTKENGGNGETQDDGMEVVVIHGAGTKIGSSDDDDKSVGDVPSPAAAAPPVSPVVRNGTMRSSTADDHTIATSTCSTDGSGASGVATKNMEALCDIGIRRQPLHLWGRYTKLSRSVPQTPWIRGDFSVQEAVSEPFEAFSGCVEGLLHGAGREDVDVRMLGSGRPFSLELVDSRRSLDEIAAKLPELQDAVNAGTGRKNASGAVTISRLRVAGPGDLPSEVQKVGEGKRKHYRCVVWVSRKVGREELEGTLCGRPELVVQQSTPLRVLHRRTLLDRPRSIFDMRVTWINYHFFQLDLTTSAGK